jgi:hypothetical protein
VGEHQHDAPDPGDQQRSVAGGADGGAREATVEVPPDEMRRGPPPPRRMIGRRIRWGEPRAGRAR